jgi:N-sulfoglucosamine sulfohydrolase
MLYLAHHWKIYTLAALIGLSLPALTLADRNERPNFVMIILDDWGGLDSGAYGNQAIKTPHIDQLAQQGLQFNNAFLTAATCSSSRASILTGIHPFAAGVPRLQVNIPADRKLLSAYLREAGYFTASVGKWHQGNDVLNQFDLIIHERQTPDESQSGSEDWVSTIESRLPKHKPFFLWLAARDAHRPFYHSKEWSIHDPEKIGIPAYIEINATHPPEFVKNELAMYYDEIHRADFYIGEVVKTLAKKQLLDNTVIIVMSDNGSPFWKAKKFLTDAGLKTPFIVYWPKQIKQHREINQLISAVDIAPTVLDLANINIPKTMEGTSFAGWLNTNAAEKPIHEFVYGERGDSLLGSENGRSIRDHQYLYIIDDYSTYTDCSDKTKQDYWRGEQLYDVINDPNNLHNLAVTQSWATRIWQKISGETDYTGLLSHYRDLMTARRKQRDDLPKPIINGSCPPPWWNVTPKDSASKNNPPSAHD